MVAGDGCLPPLLAPLPAAPARQSGRGALRRRARRPRGGAPEVELHRPRGSGDAVAARRLRRGQCRDDRPRRDRQRPAGCGGHVRRGRAAGRALGRSEPDRRALSRADRLATPSTGRTTSTQLVAAIERALEHPDELAAERRRISREVVGEVDGHAVDRIVKAVTRCTARGRVAMTRPPADRLVLYSSSRSTPSTGSRSRRSSAATTSVPSCSQRARAAASERARGSRRRRSRLVGRAAYRRPAHAARLETDQAHLARPPAPSARSGRDLGAGGADRPVPARDPRLLPRQAASADRHRRLREHLPASASSRSSGSRAARSGHASTS